METTESTLHEGTDPDNFERPWYVSPLDDPGYTVTATPWLTDSHREEIALTVLTALDAGCFQHLTIEPTPWLSLRIEGYTPAEAQRTTVHLIADLELGIERGIEKVTPDQILLDVDKDVLYEDTPGYIQRGPPTPFAELGEEYQATADDLYSLIDHTFNYSPHQITTMGESNGFTAAIANCIESPNSGTALVQFRDEIHAKRNPIREQTPFFENPSR